MDYLRVVVLNAVELCSQQSVRYIEFNTDASTTAAIPLPQDFVIRRGPEADKTDLITALPDYFCDMRLRESFQATTLNCSTGAKPSDKSLDASGSIFPQPFPNNPSFTSS